MNKNPDKILIVKLCCLGDVINSIPLLKTIKLNLPAVKITFLVANWCKDLIEIIPEIDDYILFNAPFEKSNVLKKISDSFKLIINLKQRKFDIAINLHRNIFFTLLLFLSGVKNRIGFGNSIFLNNKVTFESDISEVDRYLNLINIFNFKTIHKVPEINLDSDNLENFQGILTNFQIDQTDKLVGIFPGGGINPGTIMNIKQLKISKYIELVKNLINKNFKVYIFDTIEGSESTKQIYTEISDEKKCVLVPSLPLKRLCLILKRMSVIIGCDTGIIHLSAALGTPVIMVFGPSNPTLVAPRKDKHQIIWHKIECAPCYTPVSVQDKKNFKNKTFICKRGDVLCMELITVEEMINAFEKIQAEMSDHH